MMVAGAFCALAESRYSVCSSIPLDIMSKANSVKNERAPKSKTQSQSPAAELHEALNVPIGLLINFNEVKLNDRVHRMILPGTDKDEIDSIGNIDIRLQ